MIPLTAIPAIAASLLNPRSPPIYDKANSETENKKKYDASELEATFVNSSETTKSPSDRRSWALEALSTLGSPLIESFREAWDNCGYGPTETCAQLVSEQIARFACFQENPNFLWDCEPLLNLVKHHQTYKPKTRHAHTRSCPEIDFTIPDDTRSSFEIGSRVVNITSNEQTSQDSDSSLINQFNNSIIHDVTSRPSLDSALVPTSSLTSSSYSQDLSCIDSESTLKSLKQNNPKLAKYWSRLHKAVKKTKLPRPS